MILAGKGNLWEKFAPMKTPDFPWLDRKEYPFKHHWHASGSHRLHYVDEGHGPVLLFVHGTPSWSFDFRNVIKALSGQFRCIAMDHLGFGLSDKPADGDYSIQSHVARLSAFIRALDLREITLVVHDFGGPIGVAAGLEMPDRIKGVVAMNTWLWSSASDPDFIRFSKVLRSPLLPFLYLRLNFSPRFLLPGSFGEKKLSRSLRKQFTAPFPNAASRQGALAFARSLLNDQDWFQSLWERKAELDRWNWLLIWGMKDKFAGEKYLEGFRAGFPNARVVKLETAGHFPQEEQPEVVAAQIRKGFAG